MCIRDRPTLATRIAQAASAGINIHDLLHQAASEGTLPEEHTAAALWWRISGRLNPAVTADLQPALHPVSYTHLDVYKRQRRLCEARTQQRFPSGDANIRTWHLRPFLVRSHP